MGTENANFITVVVRHSAVFCAEGTQYIPLMGGILRVYIQMPKGTLAKVGDGSLIRISSVLCIKAAKILANCDYTAKFF